MTFTMLRSVEPLLQGAVERRLLHERIDALSRARCAVPSHARAAIARAAEQIATLA